MPFDIIGVFGKSRGPFITWLRAYQNGAFAKAVEHLPARHEGRGFRGNRVKIYGHDRLFWRPQELWESIVAR